MKKLEKPRLTLTRSTVLKLTDLKQVAGGATFDCFVKISGGCSGAIVPRTYTC